MIYEVEGEAIKALRIYMPMDMLSRELEPDTPESTDAVMERYYEVCTNQYSAAAAHALMSEFMTEDFVFYPPNNVAGYAGRDQHVQWLTWHHKTLGNQQFIIYESVSSNRMAEHVGRCPGCTMASSSAFRQTGAG